MRMGKFTVKKMKVKGIIFFSCVDGLSFCQSNDETDLQCSMSYYLIL